MDLPSKYDKPEDQDSSVLTDFEAEISENLTDYMDNIMKELDMVVSKCDETLSIKPSVHVFILAEEIMGKLLHDEPIDKSDMRIFSMAKGYEVKAQQCTDLLNKTLSTLIQYSAILSIHAALASPEEVYSRYYQFPTNGSKNQLVPARSIYGNSKNLFRLKHRIGSDIEINQDLARNIGHHLMGVTMAIQGVELYLAKFKDEQEDPSSTTQDF